MDSRLSSARSCADFLKWMADEAEKARNGHAMKLLGVPLAKATQAASADPQQPSPLHPHPHPLAADADTTGGRKPQQPDVLTDATAAPPPPHSPGGNTAAADPATAAASPIPSPHTEWVLSPEPDTPPRVVAAAGASVSPTAARAGAAAAAAKTYPGELCTAAGVPEEGSAGAGGQPDAGGLQVTESCGGGRGGGGGGGTACSGGGVGAGGGEANAAAETGGDGGGGGGAAGPPPGGADGDKPGGGADGGSGGDASAAAAPSGKQPTTVFTVRSRTGELYLTCQIAEVLFPAAFEEITSAAGHRSPSASAAATAGPTADADAAPASSAIAAGQGHQPSVPDLSSGGGDDGAGGKCSPHSQAPHAEVRLFYEVAEAAHGGTGGGDASAVQAAAAEGAKAAAPAAYDSSRVARLRDCTARLVSYNRSTWRLHDIAGMLAELGVSGEHGRVALWRDEGARVRVVKATVADEEPVADAASAGQDLKPLASQQQQQQRMEQQQQQQRKEQQQRPQAKVAALLLASFPRRRLMVKGGGSSEAAANAAARAIAGSNAASVGEELPACRRADGGGAPGNGGSGGGGGSREGRRSSEAAADITAADAAVEAGGAGTSNAVIAVGGDANPSKESAGGDIQHAPDAAAGSGDANTADGSADGDSRSPSRRGRRCKLEYIPHQAAQQSLFVTNRMLTSSQHVVLRKDLAYSLFGNLIAAVGAGQDVELEMLDEQEGCRPVGLIFRGYHNNAATDCAVWTLKWLHAWVRLRKAREGDEVRIRRSAAVEAVGAGGGGGGVGSADAREEERGDGGTGSGGGGDGSGSVAAVSKQHRYYISLHSALSGGCLGLEGDRRCRRATAVRAARAVAAEARAVEDDDGDEEEEGEEEEAEEDEKEEDEEGAEEDDEEEEEEKQQRQQQRRRPPQRLHAASVSGGGGSRTEACWEVTEGMLNGKFFSFMLKADLLSGIFADVIAGKPTNVDVPLRAFEGQEDEEEEEEEGEEGAGGQQQQQQKKGGRQGGGSGSSSHKRPVGLTLRGSARGHSTEPNWCMKDLVNWLRDKDARVGDVVRFRRSDGGATDAGGEAGGDAGPTFWISLKRRKAGTVSGGDGSGAAAAVVAGLSSATAGAGTGGARRTRRKKEDGGEEDASLPPPAASAAPSANTAAPEAAAASLFPHLPAASITHLHGYTPQSPSQHPPPPQPGELRVCGLTFHPDIAGRVHARMQQWCSEVLKKERKASLEELLPHKYQIWIPGISNDPATAT
ncbi:hypothetical protein Agub_g6582, partial [Astrephomene gubernaculifera]